MISLDFEIDETELKINIEDEPENADLDLIVLTYFIMPVRFQVNGIDFFKFPLNNPSDPWVPLPIVNIATDGLYSIKKLKVKKRIKYDLPEGAGLLQFEFFDIDKVRIIYSVNHIDISVNYEKLLEAFEKFTDKVKKFLNERVPQMRKHPYWGSWIRGEAGYKPYYDIFEH